MKTLLISFIFFSFSASAQKSTVTGVVTYYFNEYQGDKPDIGAKVYLLNNDIKKIDISAIDSFLLIKPIKTKYDSRMALYNFYSKEINENKKKFLYKSYVKSITPLADSVKRLAEKDSIKMAELNITSKDVWKALDLRASDQVIAAMMASAQHYTTVNGTGSYTINVMPGNYTILIISSGRSGQTLTEILGKVYLAPLVLKDADTKDISTNFSIN